MSQPDSEKPDGAELEDELTFPHANIDAVQAICSVFENALGPTPRDKLLIENIANNEDEQHPTNPTFDEYTVASDGATILEKLDLQHPVTPLLLRIAGPERPGESDVEGEDIPDGVKSSLLLLANLLSEAKDLIDSGVHPTTIRAGYTTSLRTARSVIREQTLDPTSQRLLNVAKTAMTGNDVGGYRDRWARLAVEAVNQINVVDEARFVVRHVSGQSIDNSQLVKGAVLDRNARANNDMPRRIEDATVLVLGGDEQGGLKRQESRREITVTPNDSDYASGFDQLRERHREEILEQILSADVDVVVSQTGINQAYHERLAEHGIIGVRGVVSLDLRQVALATGASIVYDPHDITPAQFGQAGVVREIEVPEYHTARGDRQMMIFEDCPDPSSVAILLTGIWQNVADQLTTDVRKAAAAASMAQGAGEHPPGCVPGGGAIEMEIAQTLRSVARDYGSKEQLSIEGFADATENVIVQLVRNGGLDPLNVLPIIKNKHSKGKSSIGVSFPEAIVTDTLKEGILDPTSLKLEVFQAATEVASMIINIDDAIDSSADDNPITPDEAIDDEAAERHMEYLSENEEI